MSHNTVSQVVHISDSLITTPQKLGKRKLGSFKISPSPSPLLGHSSPVSPPSPINRSWKQIQSKIPGNFTKKNLIQAKELMQETAFKIYILFNEFLPWLIMSAHPRY